MIRKAESTRSNGENYEPHPGYEQLPEVLRHKYTPKEYAWLGDHGRDRLLETECYPDADMIDDVT